MTEEELLLPCPFCGGEANFQTDKGPTGELYGWVGCNQCDAMSGHCDIRSMQPEELHPIGAWNTRAILPLIREAELRGVKAGLEAAIIAALMAPARGIETARAIGAIDPATVVIAPTPNP